MRAAKVFGVLVLVIIVLIVGASAAALVLFPRETATAVRPFSPQLAESIYPDQAFIREQSEVLPASTDADFSTESEQEAYREAHKGHPAVNPLVARCGGIDVHCPVAPADITSILFHQASYLYALELETELPEANLEVISPENPAYVNREQLDGEWLDAEALHLWRTGDTTAMDTSIDAGAAAGTELRSPVTGTVVLVKDYLLYEEMPDIEIHIQPDGRPDLDVVLIHNDNALVKAGDRVQGGVTPIAHVRDIAAGLTDVQLGFYTAAEDPGNHSHVQVNDVNYKDYREKKLEGAITVG